MPHYFRNLYKANKKRAPLRRNEKVSSDANRKCTLCKPKRNTIITV